jgi:hypothetical protein
MKAIYIKQHGAISDLKYSEVPVPSIALADRYPEAQASISGGHRVFDGTMHAVEPDNRR